VTEQADRVGAQERDLYLDAVQTLTAAAPNDTDGEPADFADLVAHALSATAANVGGLEPLLAGLPGSREAELVAELITGTIGDDNQHRLARRTEPLIIPLNVAELIETSTDHEGLLGLDDAVNARYETHTLEATGQRAESASSLTALGADIDDIIARYHNEYHAYAARFGAAIQQQATTLEVPWTIRVEADTDPLTRWWETQGIHNPDTPYSDKIDPIATELWEHAHTATSLPNVDIRPSGGMQ
jgi:hypothetical protein